jgi:hypothetical protein
MKGLKEEIKEKTDSLKTLRPEKACDEFGPADGTQFHADL